MDPLRIFIIAILLYIAWRLLINIFKPNKRISEQPSESSTVKDVLVEDPVCHTLMPKKQAIHFRQGEETYYFCSEKCCDIFSEKLKTEQQEQENQ